MCDSIYKDGDVCASGVLATQTKCLLDRLFHLSLNLPFLALFKAAFTLIELTDIVDITVSYLLN